MQIDAKIGHQIGSHDDVATKIGINDIKIALCDSVRAWSRWHQMHFCDLRDICATVANFPLSWFCAFHVQFLCMFFMDETSSCTGVEQDFNLLAFRSFSDL